MLDDKLYTTKLSFNLIWRVIAIQFQKKFTGVNRGERKLDRFELPVCNGVRSFSIHGTTKSLEFAWKRKGFSSNWYISYSQMNANSSSKASPDERQGICLPKYGVIVWRSIASSSHSTRKRNTLTNVREFNRGPSGIKYSYLMVISVLCTWLQLSCSLELIPPPPPNPWFKSCQIQRQSNASRGAMLVNYGNVRGNKQRYLVVKI